MPPAARKERYRYAAFISYRHVDPDRRWAKWLERAIETYRVPGPLIRQQGIRPRVERVFRDEAELPASADLSRQIETALQESQFLVVVCSRRTPESSWVDKEIGFFRQLGRHDRILALLIDGEPSEAYPASLREIRHSVLDKHNRPMARIEEVEPLAADVRSLPSRHESQRYLRRMARLRIVSALLGCRFDDLRQREQERQTRRWILFGVAASLLFAVMAGLAGLAICQKAEADHQRTVAEFEAEEARKARIAEAEERRKAEVAHQEALQENYYHVIALADVRLRDSQPRQAETLLLRQPPALRGWEWGRLMNLCHPDLAMLEGNRHKYELAVSGDGRYLALVGLMYSQGDFVEDVAVYDCRSGALRTVLKAGSGGINALDFSADGERLAVARDSKITIWELKTAQPVLEIAAPTGSFWAVRFSPDGRRLATGSGDGDAGGLQIWDATDGRKLVTIEGFPKLVRLVTFSPNGSTLAAISSSPAVFVFDTSSGDRLLSLEGHRLYAKCCAFSPDGALLITGGTDNTGKIWDAIAGKQIHVLEGHPATVDAVTFSRDGSRALTICGDGIVKTWDVASGRELNSRTLGITGSLDKTVFPDGKRMAMLATQALRDQSDDKWNVWIWDISGQFQSLVLPKDTSTRAVYAPYLLDEMPLLYIRSDAELDVWEVKDVRRLSDALSFLKDTSPVAISADRTRVATQDTNQTARLWDVASGRTISVIKASSEHFTHLAFSPDGKRLLTEYHQFRIRRSGTIEVWDVDTGRPLYLLPGELSALRRVSFSPDGRYIAGLLYGHRGDPFPLDYVWDAATGREVLRLERATCIAWFPCGQRLVVGQGDGTICIWDVKNRKLRKQFAGEGGSFRSIATTPDGKRVITGGTNGTAKVWDVATGRELLTLRHPDKDIMSIAFLDDGKTLVTEGYEKVYIWEAFDWSVSNENIQREKRSRYARWTAWNGAPSN